MLKKLWYKIKSVFDAFKLASHQFKNQTAYEISHVSTCPKTGQHILEIKVTGKGQSISYLAEEIVVDNSFMMGFSPSDIRTITYLATSDRYETILQKEKIKKSYEIIRSKNRTEKKTIQLRHTENGEYIVVSLNDFADHHLIDKLTSQDAYYLGYLTGQEQSWKDYMRLKLIPKSQSDLLE